MRKIIVTIQIEMDEDVLEKFLEFQCANICSLIDECSTEECKFETVEVQY